MAGDIGRRERAIVLPDVGDDERHPAQEAREALEDAGTRTMHEYGDRVVVVDLPAEAEPSVVDELGAMGGPERVAASMAGVTDEIDGLDESGALGLAAFGLRTSDGYTNAKAQRPHGEESWDEPEGDVLPPDPPHEIAEAIEGAATGGASANGSSSATSARLTGSVAVGVIIVEGPNADLKFSQAERVKVVAEVQNGLGWLGAQSAPQGITWSYDVRTVTIDAQPSDADDDLPKREARFRDPALAAMGYGAGVAGAQAYVNALRTARGTNWAFCAFFTKYPVGHFAYASLGGPRLVMHYDNDGWGPDNIDRVFAHETGHIFNAPDEYADSGCNCGGQWGHFKVANGNCDPCAGSSAVPCIMKANTWAMCSFTPYHLGFPQGARYTGVYVAGTDAHAFWTNASWNPFVAKWQQLSGQGLRLVDLDIARFGSQLRYSGTFRAGSGPYGLWALADYPSFRDKWVQWSSQGMRLVDIEITDVNGQPRYSGVFAQGSGSYGLWVNATWSSFVERWQQWSGQGLRLVDLSVHTVGTTPRYSGVFQQGTGAYALWALATWESFREKWEQWSQQGLRLVDIERTMVGNQARYSGVFRQGTGGYALWANSSWQTFRERWEQWSNNGLRLIDLAMEPTAVETLASPELAGEVADGAGLGGLLGFAGAAIAVEDGHGPVSAGEGFVELTPRLDDDQADALGTGVGDVTFEPSDGHRATDGATAATWMSDSGPHHVAGMPADDVLTGSHTGMGGASVEHGTAATVPPPSDPGTAGGSGTGDAVIDLTERDAVPEEAGIGGAHGD